uniref:EF-hand domain-containing protein n=1 Tax=Coccolithus braarudii TaxID=221442 RepID=A0A7S0Q257_9EUKA
MYALSRALLCCCCLGGGAFALPLWVAARPKGLQHLASHGCVRSPRLQRATSAARPSVRMAVVPLDDVEVILEQSANWNFLLVGAALTIGGIFEFAVEQLEERVPKRLLPVVKQSIVEFATLGFVGLVIETINHGSGGHFLGEVSARFLDEEGFLVERFEELHQGLFDITIIYFAVCTFLILRITAQYAEWDYERRTSYLGFKLAEYDWKQGVDNSSRAEKFALRGWNEAARKMEMTALSTKDTYRQPGLLGAWITQEELFASYDTRVAEFLRFRERFIEQNKRATGASLPRDFPFSDYLQEQSSKNLKELVSIEPFTLAKMWAPIAVVSVATEAAGLWVGAPRTEEAIGLSAIVLVFLGSQALLAGWAFGNFFKLRQVKAMLRPQLAQRDSSRGKVRRLLPPSYLLTGRSEQSSWGLLEPIAELLEVPFALAPRNEHEALFGTVGAAGPAYYLQSQKLVLFNAIVSIAVFFALLGEGAATSYPLLYAALLPALLTILLSPTTFLMYSWATAVEQLRDEDALSNVLRAQREQGFRAKLKTLSRLCDCFEAVAGGSCFLGQAPSQTELQAGNPDVLLNLLTVFDMADIDQEGSISRDELASIAHNLGYELTEAAVSDFFACTLKGQTAGNILFRDFASAVLSLSGNPSPTEVEGRSARLFGFFDVDRGGAITVDEMALRLARMGLDTAGTEQLFVDITGLPQNTVSCAEFGAYLRRIGFWKGNRE